MASTESKGIPIHGIAADGDLILAIGSPVKVKLQVSSEVLKTKSSVFSALLSPRFREGQTSRSVDQPQTIDLPEDLPDGMTYLCKLLHGQSVEELPLSPTTKALLQVAIAADKYDAMSLLQLQMQSWLYACLDKVFPPRCENLSRLACVAYLARHKRVFAKATNGLMLDCIENFDRIDDGIRLSDYMPPRVFEAISCRRLQAFERLVMDVPQLEFVKDAERDEEISAAFESDAVSWASQKRSISETASCILDIKGLEDAREAQWLYSRVRDLCSGLCLQCALGGGYLTMVCVKKDH